MVDMELDFKGKYFISADLRLITGLHIGGTEDGLEIGGMDNPVIKDPTRGVPYIPGSSLKGKMRSLLEWVTELKPPGNGAENPEDDTEKKHGMPTCVTAQLKQQMAKLDDLKKKVEEESDAAKKAGMEKELGAFRFSAGPCTCAECDICIVFGVGAEHRQKGRVPGPTRLTVCDAFPKEDDAYNQKSKWETAMDIETYTEVKAENALDRLTSAANPRFMERVPADSVFSVEFIYDVYNEKDYDRLKILFQGMTLLEDSSLGGGGSRGSGRVRFENISIDSRDINYYRGETGNSKLKQLNIRGGKKMVREVFDEFNSLLNSATVNEEKNP